MGNAVPHALGRELKFYANEESTYGTFAKPAGTDAAKVLATNFEMVEAREGRADSRQTRSLLERITGRREVSWSVESYVLPSGSAGTPPDIHPMLKNALGTYANVGGTSDTYSPSKTDSDFVGMTLVRHLSDVYMEAIFGAVVQTLGLAVTGTEPARFSFDGFGASWAKTGYSTASGVYSGGTVDVQANEGENFDAGSVVKLGSDDNSGAGWEVTSVSNDELTISGSPSGSDADAVSPFAPTETTAGSPLWGLTGSFTVGGTAHPITGFNLQVANNFKAINDEHNQNKVTDFIQGLRAVTGDFSFRMRRDQIIRLLTLKNYATAALVCGIGTVAGKILTANVPYAELEWSAVEVPEAEEATVTVPFTALGSSGEDECSLVFT